MIELLVKVSMRVALLLMVRAAQGILGIFILDRLKAILGITKKQTNKSSNALLTKQYYTRLSKKNL